jgi:hypothetical protein
MEGIFLSIIIYKKKMYAYKVTSCGPKWKMGMLIFFRSIILH